MRLMWVAAVASVLIGCGDSETEPGESPTTDASAEADGPRADASADGVDANSTPDSGDATPEAATQGDGADGTETAPPDSSEEDGPIPPDGFSAVCVPAATPSNNRAVAALEYGNIAVVDVVARSAQDEVAPEGAVSTDAVLRYAGGVVYAVNRYNMDEVVLLDSNDFHLVDRFSTGKGTNPQDIAALNANRLYVPALSSGEVLVCDPDQPDGQEVVRRIDLKGIDPNPSPTSVLLTDYGLVVPLAFMDPDTLAPTRNGLVVVIDPKTDGIIAQIGLNSQDPYARAIPIPGTSRVLVNGAGDFSGKTGCFELVDTATGSSKCIVDNAQCGGPALAMTATSSGHVFAIVRKGSYGRLCHFTVDGTHVEGPLPIGENLMDIALNDRCELYAAEQIAPDGIRVIDPATLTERIPTPIHLGGNPAFQASIVFMP